MISLLACVVAGIACTAGGAEPRPVRVLFCNAEDASPPITGRSIVDLTPATATSSAKQPRAAEANPDRDRDVVIYGGTASAVIAAIRATMLGADVVVVSPDKHLGGLTSGGLGYTDSGNTRAIGGLAREFYRRVWKHYQQPEAWNWQPRDTFRARGQGVKQADTADHSMWLFEPHVAERIFDGWLAEHGIEVIREARLDRERGVEILPASGGVAGPRIRSITTLAGPAGQGRRFPGKVFIDATYEGDLMAAAGVTYHVGREANAVYGEEWNGNQVGILHHAHFFQVPVDPFKTPGDPQSGLLPLISADPPGTRGEGDTRVQAYCFRMCLTDHPDNRLPFEKPPGYDPARYELLARVLAAGWGDVFGKFDAIPNRKTDTNNHGPVSFDQIGANYDYPEASYERRREIVADHERYQKGMLWFLSHDERVPADIRTRMQQWGLPKDEYGDNGHWSPQLYIREARRMVGSDMLTEHECLGKRIATQPIGMGSYALDSHNVRRYVTPEGTVQNEGDIGVYPKQPYHISYGSLVPKRQECANLLVPVCLSASHIAYGSARMEPVFMLLGDAAANAAVLAARAGSAVQDVDYPSLCGLLESQGQVLEIPSAETKPVALPWNMDTLREPPAVEWLDDTAPVRSLLYEGEPFQGRATRVFAYYATPVSIGGGRGARTDPATTSGGPWPGIVLVHGGGGTAFADWVTLWARRGYAAIAMDLAGCRPDPAAAKKNAATRLPDGGPGQEHADKFDTIATPDATDDWPYHAVASVIRAHSLLRSLPGVDPDRTAITGISWGGYTTCIVASLDDRFRAAVPVYGCGHLRDNSCWLGEFARLGTENAARWAERYDPAQYLPACRVPIFFVNGTNDFAYPLDSFMKSYADVRHAAKTVRIEVNMPHGHEEGWAPPEIAAFIDAAVLGTPGLPVLDTPRLDDAVARCRVISGRPVAKAAMVSTTEAGAINKLTWKTVPAEVKADGSLVAPRPPADARAYFFTAATPAGLVVSSPAVIVPAR